MFHYSLILFSDLSLNKVVVVGSFISQKGFICYLLLKTIL